MTTQREVSVLAACETFFYHTARYAGARIEENSALYKFS